MTRPVQDLALTNAITDLTWCTRPPHTLEQITDLSRNRFPRTRWAHGATTDEMAAAIYNEAQSDEYGPPPPWADPTGEAVAAGRASSLVGSHIDTNRAPSTDTTPRGDSGDDPTPSAIDSAIDLLYYSADELTMLCLDQERIAPATSPVDKLDATITSLSRVQPLVIQARDRMDRMGRDHMDLLVYLHISETAEWLRAKGEVLCGDRKRMPAPTPGDRPTGCVSCARDRGPDGRPYFQPVDEKNHSKRRMCRTCGDYASAHVSMLPLGAVEYMHRTGKQVTSKVIMEAERNERAS